MDRVIRVLVVDDSAYVRKVIKEMLSRSPFLEVVGTARDGEEALEQVESLRPDVITLDLIMPQMDGVQFLRTLMPRHPIPVVVISIASESGDLVLSALDAGAVDFIQKPTALATEKVFDIAEELVDKVKAAATMRVLRPLPSSPKPLEIPTSAPPTCVGIVVIGISTGGPQALKLVIPQLPADFPVPIAIVLHMPVGYTELYAQKLNEISRLRVVEAHEGQAVEPGTVLLAPAGRHMTLRRNSETQVTVHLDVYPTDTLHRPSADVLFQSAAEAYGSRVLGIVMTGMGSDGKQGAAWIKAQGGMIYAEAESTCVVYGMPRSVVEAGLADRIVTLDQMPRTILETVCEVR